MKRVRINLGERSYPIIIGRGVIFKLKDALAKLNLNQTVVIVTNPTINRLYGRLMIEALKGLGLRIHFAEVPDSEQSKSVGQCIKLIERFTDLDRGSGIFVIAFGGGVIGDLAGFAASIYRRGVPYIQVPTTLLAQVDSSIGGKVALDLPCGKNLIGAFYQPRLVLSDLVFLKSLGPAQIRQALAEIIKYAVISASHFFEFLEKHLDKILAQEQKKLQYIIELTSQIKAKIVEQDEFDRKKKRIILNFGHTTAHALEAASGYSADYAHGEAVALGMLVAIEIAKQLKLISAYAAERIEALISKAGLPTKISGLKLAAVLKAQGYDKKFSAGKNRFVLPVCIGKVVVKEDIPQRIIAKAIMSRM